MTKEDILNMKEGRKIDILIADFMGGEWFNYKCGTEDLPRYFNGIVIRPRFEHGINFQNLVKFNSLEFGKLEGKEFGAYHGDEYSSDQLAAWEVLERFPIAKVTFVEIFEGHKSYSVTIPCDNGDICIENERSLPLAICKAALIAIMKDSMF